MFLFSPSVLGANLEQSEELPGCVGACLAASPAPERAGEKVVAISRLPATEPGRDPALPWRGPFRCEGGGSQVKNMKIRVKAGAVPRPGRCWMATGEGFPPPPRRSPGTPTRARTRGTTEQPSGRGSIAPKLKNFGFWLVSVIFGWWVLFVCF